MRKKLLTIICAFSAMSILCTTTVMAQTTLNVDTCKQTNGTKMISICNFTNCDELDRNITSLKVNCNVESLCEYLQDLINFNCNQNTNDVITQPEEDIQIPEQNDNVPEQDTDVPEQDTDIPEENNNTPEPVVTATPLVTNTPIIDNIENTDFVSQIAELVNAERAKIGLSPVTLDATLSKAAQVRAKEIVNQFSHTRPNGSSFSTAITEQEFSFRGAGENIAYGQETPQTVMNAWMNSDGHRANILNANYTTIGVGYYQQNGINYWTQLFTY